MNAYDDAPPPPRAVLHRYDDPVDAVWVALLAELGFELHRDDGAYASFDGDRTLTIATPATLDADDCLAQMILHELCHAMVAGDRGRAALDWGLDNTSARDLVAEHATHRLQAALADRHGLRGLLAVTTDWRPYWDALPADPLADDDADAGAIERARRAAMTGRRWGWLPRIDAALARTAAVAGAVRAVAAESSLWALTRPLHVLGTPRLAGRDGARCGDCAWQHRDGPGDAPRCRQHGDRALPSLDEPACERFEPTFDRDECARCGACCRQAFHLVPVDEDAPLVSAHPELVAADDHGLHVPRPGGFCAALEAPCAPYRCRVYPLRPTSCDDFEVAGASCLDARQRLGLSARNPFLQRFFF